MSKQLLFIDDEPEFISQHKLALTRAGYNVVEAFTYEEAKNLLIVQIFDLIILDLIISRDGETPEDDENEPDVEIGLRLHREIREDLKISKTPILFFSVVNDSVVFQRIQTVEKKFGKQKINFLNKPQLPSRLVTMIRNMIG